MTEFFLIDFVLLILAVYMVWTVRALKQLNRKVNNLMATQKEHEAILLEVKARLTKAAAEIVAKIKELTDAVAAGGTTSPEVDTAAADLKTLAQGLDDVVADAETPPV